MASDEEILNNTAGEEVTEDEVAKLMKELNLDEDLQFDDLIDANEEEGNSDSADELNSADLDFDSLEDEIPTEEVLDMDEIDAILSDISDVHPDRSISAEELEERIAKYEENPEAAEEALLGNEDEEAENENAENTPDVKETPEESVQEETAGEKKCSRIGYRKRYNRQHFGR